MSATTGAVAGLDTLTPVEHMALTVARSRAERGETVEPNTGLMLVSTVDRLLGRLADLTKPLEREKPVIVDHGDGKVYACPECGSPDFLYEEDYGTDRKMAENNADAGAIAFYGDFQWYEGDSTPGVICAELSCRTPIDMDGIEEDFQ